MDPARDRGGAPLSRDGRARVSESEARYFDLWARERGEFDAFAPRGWRTIARRFAEMAPASSSEGSFRRALDVGCGSGASRQIYAGRTGAHEYVGIDLSFQALALARRVAARERWTQADACRLPFADSAFDVVTFSSVLHHIPDFAPALAEARRVLRPGGRVFAFDPNLLHPAMAALRWPRSPLYVAEGVSPNEAPLHPRRLRREFEAAGFVEIRQRGQSAIAFRKVAPRLVNALLSVFNAADWAFEKIGLGRWFGTFVLTAGRKPAETRS